MRDVLSRAATRVRTKRMTESPRAEYGGQASDPRLIVLAGPTASGKSALALALAERFGGVIINADAMQCYAELRVLTARPSVQDEGLAPHELYGVRRVTQPADAAWWRWAALAAMARARTAGRTPILCGGTGLYLRGLFQGLADIPDPGAAARAEARALVAGEGAAALHARLQAVDPQTAAGLRPSDSQRVARAWEVWRGTGRGLAAWQAVPAVPLAGWRPVMIMLDPPRLELRAAIAARFEAMLLSGAIEEVRALAADDLDQDLPGLRAHGVPELRAYLRGEIDLAQAAARAITATAQYTRRQATWFRHQALVHESAIQIINARMAPEIEFYDKIVGDAESFINSRG